jgi:hypothetical protein
MYIISNIQQENIFVVHAKADSVVHAKNNPIVHADDDDDDDVE